MAEFPFPHRRPPSAMPTLLRKLVSTAAARRAAAYARRVSRATRRLLRAARPPRRDFTQLVPAPTDDVGDHQEEDAGEGEGEGEGGLWRRAILMGERCKPLDFPGAIHYDSSGHLLPAAPAPRRRIKAAAGGALLCRSSACDVDEAATAPRSKGRLAANQHV